MGVDNIDRKTMKQRKREQSKPLTIIVKLKGFGSRTHKFFPREYEPKKILQKVDEKVKETLEKEV